MRQSIKRVLLAVAAAAVPAAAYAHPAIGEAAGLGHGFAHPMTGLDHILAMVMVGVLAFQLGGRATWLLPTTFVLVMAAGGMLGMAGINLPFVELGIALSVVVLGAVVALNIKAPVAAAMAIVGFFAIFHGHAHGSEMPENAAGLAYAIGFMTATAMLHVAGLALGFAIGRGGERSGFLATRLAGGIATIAGVGILAGLI
ncbi:urease accessory protein [Rhizobium sp. BK529]|uniref:HupE/UreJ family protein n=1 Tax=unclassified Rhizobium TaxID=2613769 RepID=UPI001050E2A4|nr:MULTISPECIES: HupE/UreJ family protein [unclassified Rhizobium]MBB3595831.1 urease accessory protein [Rhizobium sp. BK529]TCR95144.1 urease accessory protein [Rhizobium sp. BK418]